MSSVGCSEDMLQQFWSMLDDLSQNDHNAYQRFIEQHMKKGAESTSPPEPYSCLHTEIITEPKEVLYINVCTWRRVPAPQEDLTKPMPLVGGKLQRITEGDKDSWYTVLDVAFNPTALRLSKTNKAMEKLYLLLLSFAQKQHGLKLSQQYTVTSHIKGRLSDIHRRLGVDWQLSKWSATRSTQPDTATLLATQTPASLLQKISSRCEEESESNLATELIVGPAKNKKNLIEVISSRETAHPQLEYQLRVNTDSEGSRRWVELMVDMPNVCSMSECQLSVSKDDVLLEVKAMQRLLVELPEIVNEDTASGTFNKKKRRLTLTVDIL